MNKFFLYLIAGAIAAACTGGAGLPSQKTESGIPYELNVDAPGEPATEGKYVSVELKYTSASDSVFFNTFGLDPNYYFVGTPSGYGDPNEWYLMLSEGDSATFYLSADSLFKMMMPPAFIQRGEVVTVVVKMNQVVTQDEYQDIQVAQLKARLEPELEVIRQHLRSQGIAFEETSDGVIYTIEKAGTGDKPKTGEKVLVHYTGKLLDGTKFDSSLDRGQPFPIIINESQVIRGWHIGIPLFAKGGKGTIYIPPTLGYGAQGAGDVIPGNTPLQFDIEIVDILDPKAAIKKDLATIREYLNQKGITNFMESPDGIIYTIAQQGNGPTPAAGQQVTVHYTGMLLNGTKFDSSKDRNQPFQFQLGRGQVIRGWDLGIPLFNVGGSGTLYLPSSLAYGEQGAGASIPPNSILIFDVEVLGVQ